MSASPPGRRAGQLRTSGTWAPASSDRRTWCRICSRCTWCRGRVPSGRPPPGERSARGIDQHRGVVNDNPFVAGGAEALAGILTFLGSSHGPQSRPRAAEAERARYRALLDAAGRRFGAPGLRRLPAPVAGRARSRRLRERHRGVLRRQGGRRRDVGDRRHHATGGSPTLRSRHGLRRRHRPSRSFPHAPGRRPPGVVPSVGAEPGTGRSPASGAAVGPTVTCVIDNVTPREARGWYAVLVRSRDGHRTLHPFKLGDAAASGRLSAPFLNPNRTGELRAEVEALLADAREQWERWRSNQDAGARHEAKRMVADALLIWPGHPAAQRLLAEIG